MKKIKYTLLVLLPNLAFAQLNGIKGLLQEIMQILSSIVPILFGLSIVYFFWGLAQFILNDAGNDKTREDGKNKIIWGIVALFVFVAIYGILFAIGDALGIRPGGDFSGIFGP